MMAFHTLEYLEFLRDVKPSNVNEFPKEKLLGYNVGEDWFVAFTFIYCSPIFEGIYNFCSLYTGASLMGARYLNEGVIFELA